MTGVQPAHLAGLPKHERSAEQGTRHQKAHEGSLLGQVPEPAVQLLRREQVHDIDQGACVRGHIYNA